MKLLADECCDAPLISELSKAGHDVTYVCEVPRLIGASDRQVLALTVQEDRILLTEDTDFGELVYRLRMPAKGIILLRFGPREFDEKLRTLIGFLEDQSDLEGALSVLTKDSVRMRPLRS